MAQDKFWFFYKQVEEASRLSFEDFLADDSAFRRALEGIRGCLSVVEEEARTVAGKMGLDAGGGLLEVSWRLAKAHVIDVKLLEDLEDVFWMAQGGVDRATLYSALIRSMEVVEAVWSSLRSAPH